MRITSSLLLLLLLLFFKTASADYGTYYSLINQAEETFVTKENKECFKYYDSAFTLYRQPFVKDAYIAAEIAYYLKDTATFYRYLALAFKNGLPLSSVQSAPLLRFVDTTRMYGNICRLFEENKTSFRVDSAARNTVWLYCYESDSLKNKMGRSPEKRQLWFASENRFRDYLYDHFIRKDIFPNERMIGIATDSLYAAFLTGNRKADLYAGFGLGNDPPDPHAYRQDYDLLAKYAFSVLLHSKCSYWKFRDNLWQAVLNGYMQPKEYALLHTTSTVWNQYDENKWDDCSIQRQDLYYYLLPEELKGAPPSGESLLLIEEHRKAIFLQKYAVDLLKKQIQDKTGIWFFYDFLDRPRK